MAFVMSEMMVCSKPNAPRQTDSLHVLNVVPHLNLLTFKSFRQNASRNPNCGRGSISQ